MRNQNKNIDNVHVRATCATTVHVCMNVYTSMPGMRCLESACVLRGDSMHSVGGTEMYILHITVYLWTNCFINICI